MSDLDERLKDWASERVAPDPSAGSTARLVAEARRGKGRGPRTALVVVAMAAAALLVFFQKPSDPVLEEEAVVVEDAAPTPVAVFTAGPHEITAEYIQASERVVAEFEGATLGVAGRVRFGAGEWILDTGALGIDTPAAVAVEAGDLRIAGLGRFEIRRGEDIRVFVRDGAVDVERGGREWLVEAGRTLILLGGEVRIEQLENTTLKELLHPGLWIDEALVEVIPPKGHGEPIRPDIVEDPPEVDLAELRSRLVFGDENVRLELRTHLARVPGDAEAWALLAKAERMRKDSSAELEAWEQAAAVGSGHVANEARFEAARLAPTADAAAHLEAILANSPGALEPEARLQLGRILFEAGDPRGAEELRRVVEEHPGTAAAKSAEGLLR